MTRSINLSELAAGAEGIVAETSCKAEEGPLLRAMGLEPGGRIRVARQGEPCIVEVNGSRIGLSSDISRQVQVNAPT